MPIIEYIVYIGRSCPVWWVTILPVGCRPNVWCPFLSFSLLLSNSLPTIAPVSSEKAWDYCELKKISAIVKLPRAALRIGVHIFLPAQNWRLTLWTIILLGWSLLALTITRSNMKIVCDGFISYEKFWASAIARGTGVQGLFASMQFWSLFTLKPIVDSYSERLADGPPFFGRRRRGKEREGEGIWVHWKLRHMKNAVAQMLDLLRVTCSLIRLATMTMLARMWCRRHQLTFSRIIPPFRVHLRKEREHAPWNAIGSRPCSLSTCVLGPFIPQYKLWRQKRIHQQMEVTNSYICKNEHATLTALWPSACITYAA
jgi:hypothetical protein